MQGSQSGNLGRRRDRWQGKPRAAAVIAVVALVSLAAVACSSGKAERSEGGDQGAVVLGSDGTSLQPTSDPGPSRFAERFDSPLNGLSIGYPSGWRTRAATEPWGHGAVAFGAPDVDVIFHPKLKEDLYIAVVSEPLGGSSGSDWVNDMWTDLESVGICRRAFGSGGGGDTFHGNDAWFEGCDTPVGSDGVVIVGTATRGYIIDLHVGDERAAKRAERRLQATYGRNFFEGVLLQTVDLRPEVEVSNASASP